METVKKIESEFSIIFWNIVYFLEHFNLRFNVILNVYGRNVKENWKLMIRIVKQIEIVFHFVIVKLLVRMCEIDVECAHASLPEMRTVTKHAMTPNELAPTATLNNNVFQMKH